MNLTRIIAIGSLLVSNAVLATSQKAQVIPFTTQQGIQVLLVQDPTTELVSVNLAFKGAGSKADPKGKEGLGSALIQVLQRSDLKGLTRHEQVRKIESMGALSGINTVVTQDHIEMNFKCPRDQLSNVLSFIRDRHQHTTLTHETLQVLQSYDPMHSRLATSDEESFAFKYLLNKVFKDHPYAYLPDGSMESQQSITLEDIQRALKTRFTRDHLIVSVVGNLSQAQLSQALDKTFAFLPTSTTLKPIQDRVPQLSGKIKRIVKDTPQSGVVFAQEGLSPNHSDYDAFVLLNNILGGKPCISRLWVEVREKEGLVYGISTESFSLSQSTLLLGSFRANNQDVDRVIEIIKTQWALLQDQGVTPAELKDAQTGLIGEHALSFTSPDDIAANVLAIYLAGFDVNAVLKNRAQRIHAVTLEDINRVANTYLTPDKLTFVVVGGTS